MPQMPSPFTETEIFGRIVHPEDGNLPQEISQFMLNLRFGAEDITHLNELAEKNNQGLLTTVANPAYRNLIILWLQAIA